MGRRPAHATERKTASPHRVAAPPDQAGTLLVRLFAQEPKRDVQASRRDPDQPWRLGIQLLQGALYRRAHAAAAARTSSPTEMARNNRMLSQASVHLWLRLDYAAHLRYLWPCASALPVARRQIQSMSHGASSSRRRTKSSAVTAAKVFTISRPPRNRHSAVRVSRGSDRATAIHTMPTGFCSEPPPGPAMPVMATPTCACDRASAPSASAPPPARSPRRAAPTSPGTPS